jgi:hypothetical protein
VRSTRNRSSASAGGQYARRLVEDQHVGAAIQSLQNFDALLGADRDILDDGIGIDVQPVFLGQTGQFLPGALEARAEHGAVLGAEHDVFEDGEIIDQHEMLVHHADAERQRVAAVGDGMGSAVDADFAAIGSIEAVEDGHQRRLAGAVLADDAVHRAAPDLEVDVLVGMHRAEALVDADQFDREV